MPMAAIRGIGSIAAKGAKGALDFIDYALDTDGTRAIANERARIEREFNEKQALIVRNAQALAGMNGEAEQRQKEWQDHLAKMRVKSGDGPDPNMNENHPVYVEKMWRDFGAMGTEILRAGEAFMLNNPSGVLIDGVTAKPRRRKR